MAVVVAVSLPFQSNGRLMMKPPSTRLASSLVVTTIGFSVARSTFSTRFVGAPTGV